MTQEYDVIIAGGGPTGVALGIELGLNNINTLILEKHKAPLLSPRAQFLNARSMEFFMRWESDTTLQAKQVLPRDFPMQGVWCSKLNDKAYAIASSHEQLNDQLSPHRGIRIPLWVTEEVLRNRLQACSSVTFLKEHPIIDIHFENERITVLSKDQTFSTKFIIACDGANSLTRQKINIPFETLAAPQRVINIMFESLELEKLVTVGRGFLYYLLEAKRIGAIGPVDLNRGLWYAQVRDDGTAKSIDDLDLDQILTEMTGISFEKKIVQAHFWNMHIQLAQIFSKENRAFLVGDSAHAFVPTGGYGLNTGLGDVTNLGWKLAAVIKGRAHADLLQTYEQERRPVCLRNLHAAQKNADDMMSLRKKHDPKLDPEGFAKANAELAKQHILSLGSNMGYAFFDSPLTLLQKGQSTEPMNPRVYQPTTAPGYFLPHSWVNDRQSIYTVLSPTQWTLIISGAENPGKLLEWKTQFEKYISSLAIVKLNKDQYSAKYILIRPDWHIAFASETLEQDYFKKINIYWHTAS